MNLIETLNKLPHHMHPDFTGDSAGLYQGENNYPLLAKLANELNPKSILEIGVRLGWSAVAFLSGATEATRYVGVDHQEVAGSNQMALDNIEAFCAATNRLVDIAMIDTDFRKLPDFQEGFDLIFADALHTYEGTYECIASGWRFLNAGGSLIVDDSCMPDVRRAIERFVSETGAPNYNMENSLRGDWVITKSPTPTATADVNGTYNLPQVGDSAVYQTALAAGPIECQGGDITLTVATGLGDIFWTYQKFAPYFDRIHFDIACMGSDSTKEENRAVDWLKLLPKTGEIRLVSLPDVAAAIGYQKPTLADAIADHKSGASVVYCCNRWLEEGARIDEIDPGAQVEFGIDIRSEPVELPFDEYAILYIAGVAYPDGSTEPVDHLRTPEYSLWSVNKYLKLLDQLQAKHLNGMPVIMIGAIWDAHLYPLVQKHLEAKGIKCAGFFDKPAAQVVHVIKNAKFMLAYQCGLSVIADNFDVPQVVMYLTKYDKARYAWCKPGNVKSICFETTYASTPKQIVDEYMRIAEPIGDEGKTDDR